MSYPFFFTWSDQRSAAAEALEVTGGAGCYFYTADGGKWLDLGSLSYQAALGLNHPRVVAAIQKQAASLCLAGPTAVFPAKTQLSERLLALAPPGYTKVFFTLGGAEANENAMKIARMFTGRFKFVSRYRSYHGASMGAISLSGDFRRPPVEPGLPGAIHVLEGADQIEQVLELEGPRTVAAVFLEPVPGANGVVVPPADYWPRVRAACDRHGTLLVADEVLTGFGRTGRTFGFEHFGATPDIITVAKGLTAGHAPLGAVLVHGRIAAHFDDRPLWAGLTYYAHPLGCAAGVAALDVYRDERLFEHAERLGPTLRACLDRVCERAPQVASAARGIGLLAALDLRGSDAMWRRLAVELSARRLSLHLSKQRGTAIFAPPLIITREELEAGLEGFGDALCVASSETGT
jgi:taurine--2-oxoglutarate transaminase